MSFGSEICLSRFCAFPKHLIDLKKIVRTLELLLLLLPGPLFAPAVHS
jgi:hypothetical protein